MTNMRRIIAQRMIESRRTSAHVHCMFEVDLTRIVNLRNKLKSGFEQRNGARLTFMPFFVRAAIIALQQFPIVNASMEFPKQLHYPGDVIARMSVGKPGRSSFDTRFELYRADAPGTLYARGAAKVVWVDYAAGKSVPIPDLLRQMIETAAPVAS